ncbi:MAG: hypothetical protein SH847_18690 [Roseiflexaceae bacterium]|nr:hypothetical protein [Roseiflexaceae bacterium]
MELATSIIKYLFVIALGIEGLLIVRAVVNLARDKARTAKPPAAIPGE